MRPCAFNYSLDARAMLVETKCLAAVFCCSKLSVCVVFGDTEDELKLTCVDEQSIHIIVGTDRSQDETASRSKHQCGEEYT